MVASNVASRCTAKILRISNDLKKIHHEKAYLQLRSLDFRASVRNQVCNGSLFTCIDAALQLQCEQQRSFAVSKIGIGVGYRPWQLSSATFFSLLIEKVDNDHFGGYMTHILMIAKRHGLANLAFRI